MFDKASRSRDKLFTVLVRANEHGIARLGLAISRKHCRRATARNRIKRIIRESFREQQAQLRGIDVVVINRPAATTAGNDEIRGSLDKHWQRCSKAKQEPKSNG